MTSPKTKTKTSRPKTRSTTTRSSVLLRMTMMTSEPRPLRSCRHQQHLLNRHQLLRSHLQRRYYLELQLLNYLHPCRHLERQVLR